jgi:serine phosphatase RsbU (regulator of sigma subunit)
VLRNEIVATDVEISDESRAALGRMVPRLVERAHRMEPCDSFRVLAEEAATVGLHELQFFLIDKQQLSLTAAHDPAETVPVVGTILGDTYSNQRPHSGAAKGGRRITVPLVDGEDRLGVMTAVTMLPREEAFALGHIVAALAAEVLVAKDSYTDEFERIRRSQVMSLAAEMRWALLPPLTFRSPRVSITGILAPAYDIAGDAFDYAVNGDVAHLAIFDAVGHGLEAARVANLAIAAYRHSRRRGDALWDSAVAIDDALAEQFQRQTFVTALLADLDLESGRLEWVNAGHPRPIVLRNGRVVAELATTPMPPLGLGMLSAVPELGATRLEPRDSVLLFSDGIIEARAPSGEFFGTEGLSDHLVRSTATGVLQPEALRRLVGRLMEFRAGALRDDATLLFVTWRQADS